MSAVKVRSDKAVATLSLEHTKCRFGDGRPDGYKLKNYKRYSFANCLLECEMEYAKEELAKESNGTNCVPWYLPNIESSNSTMCDPWDALVFVSKMENVPDGKCDDCVPDCESLTYTEVSAIDHGLLDIEVYG